MAILAVVVARDLRQFLREVLSGIVAVPGRIIEPDAIRQRVVAEEALELAARQRVRPVEVARIVGIRHAADTQARAQDIGARGNPLEARLVQQLDRRGTDRPFRGPAAHGVRAKRCREHTQAFRDMPCGPLGTARIVRMMRQRHARHGLACGLKIQQQRNDRMTVGRD